MMTKKQAIKYLLDAHVECLSCTDEENLLPANLDDIEILVSLSRTGRHLANIALNQIAKRELARLKEAVANLAREGTLDWDASERKRIKGIEDFWNKFPPGTFDSKED